MGNGILLALFATAAVSTAAYAQAPLKSFAYGNDGCIDYYGAPMLTFAGSIGMDPGNPPGAGQFPNIQIWMRKISVTYLGGGPNDWVVIGHSGPNGDWVTPAIPTTAAPFVIDFPLDAPVLFNPSEYLDAHVNQCTAGAYALVAVWYEAVQ